MASTPVISAIGLNTQPNQLSVPEGSLKEAIDVVIRRDNVIESRRGISIFGNSFGNASDYLKSITSYKNILLRHFGSTLQFERSAGNFVSFQDAVVEAQPGLRIKYVESNGNFYFTTSEGIKKISAKNTSQITGVSGQISRAGGIKAVDITAILDVVLGSSTGFLPQDSTVAYRVVWGKRDSNSNLVLGTPSQRFVVYNSLQRLITQDYNNLIIALDNIAQTNTGKLDTYGYGAFPLSINALGSEIKTALEGLVTQIDSDIVYVSPTQPAVSTSAQILSTTTAQITYSSSLTNILKIGDKVTLSNYTAGVLTQLNGKTFNVVAINGAGTTASLTLLDITSPLTVQANTADIGGVTTSYTFAYIYDYATPTHPIAFANQIVDDPTPNEQLLIAQSVVLRVMDALKDATNAVVDTTARTLYADTLDITTTANVNLTITFPDGLGADDFFQIYRSLITSATGVSVLQNLSPNDELRLVYEAYPTATELTNKQALVLDSTSEAFAGANLYTNPSSGEGISQSNEPPPFAKDIARFKNVVFYLNTRTRQRKLIDLLGVSNITSGDKLVISNGVTSNTYTFVLGQTESTEFTVTAAAGLNGQYFTINSANDLKQFYVWYYVIGSTETDPAITGKTGVKVILQAADTALTVATKTANTLASLNASFITEVGAVNTFIATNVVEGYCLNATAGTTSFVVNILTQGVGEDAALRQVLLSSVVSRAQAIDETARSLARIINKNTAESIAAYYISTADGVPGKLLLEAKTLDTPEFYLLASSSGLGGSFNPPIAPSSTTISSIAVGNPTILTFSAAHGLETGDKIIIVNSNSTPSVDGLYSVSVLSPTTLTVPVNVTVAGTSAKFSKAVDAEVSENEEKKNRVYYSKFQQPESVPLVNYFDVGAEDRDGLRIFPLRDTLFVFKEDGLYRISGDSAPFNLTLFDSSCILIAPDSVDVSNNNLYCWTRQGIYSVNESGAETKGRPIDVDLLKIATYPNFKTATFGVGYESDNSYLVWTTKNKEDLTATICYRYSPLTNTWTTYNRQDNCGYIRFFNDKLYVGPTDTNFIEQERKDFERSDFSDREFTRDLTSGNYFGKKIKLLNVTNIKEGDVFFQGIGASVYEFNSLLSKLDFDPGTAYKDYESTLKAIAGDSMRQKLEALATKLDLDAGVIQTDFLSAIRGTPGFSTAITGVSINDNPTVITSNNHGLQTGRIVTLSGLGTSPSINTTYTVTRIDNNSFSIPDMVISVTDASGNFTVLSTDLNDITASYNIIASKLNLDISLIFTNYNIIDFNTNYETVVLSVDKVSKVVTVAEALDFVQGQITIFKSIKSTFTYAPLTLGDPISLKQHREIQLFFENKAFTNASMYFSSDLKPLEFRERFNGDGNGAFGTGTGFFGNGYFGGSANGAPVRIIVPRDCQRSRYLLLRFEHTVAREGYSIFGTSVTFETTSTRGYQK